MATGRKLTYTVVLEEYPPGQWQPMPRRCQAASAEGAQVPRLCAGNRAALRLHLDELSAHGGALPVERRSPAVQVVVAA